MLLLDLTMMCVLASFIKTGDTAKWQTGRRAGRVKRKVENFYKNPERKWTNPIVFKFDGTHTEREQSILLRAVDHYHRETCIRFFHAPKDLELPFQHLFFTRQARGCFSYVGRISISKQQINLNADCFKKFGVPVHEIGHALGFWHEHQRADRDRHITVLFDNIGIFESQFWRRNTISGGVPYDLGSVMQYSEKKGSVNGKPTILANDPLYQKSMGQRIGLSYLDSKTLNFFYCSDVCRSPLPRPCQHGGYQDPNSCSSCRCPDGFAGRFCEQLAPSNKAHCGGKLFATPLARFITSPGYDPSRRGSYDDRTECYWKITAPVNHTVELTFEDEFGIYCEEEETCYHWLEVKYKRDKEQSGPRFCCYDSPLAVIRSESRDMILIFKSDYTTMWATDRKGFRVKFTAKRDFPSLSPTTLETTTNVHTTTTHAPTTTTTIPATTSDKPTTTTSTATTTATTTTTTTTPTTSATTTSQMRTTTSNVHTTTATTKGTPRRTTTMRTTTTAVVTSASVAANITTASRIATSGGPASTTSPVTSSVMTTAVDSTVPTSVTTVSTTTLGPGVMWSAWSQCSQGGCKCGGCTFRTRYLICGNVRCSGQLGATDTAPCELRLCTAGDKRLVYAGRFYYMDCPPCCAIKGFRPGNGKCVSDA